MDKDIQAYSSRKAYTKPGSYAVLERPTNGMTLRDYFAGQALAGMMCNPEAFNNPSKAAAWSYQFVDEMLKARSNQNE